MNAQEIISAMYKAENQAFDAWESSWNEFVEENGFEPNWDDSIIYWDGEKAGWFNGGDAAMNSETSGMLRFSLNFMEMNSGDVEAEVQAWLNKH